MYVFLNDCLVLIADSSDHVLNASVPSSAITNTSAFVPTLLTNPLFTNVSNRSLELLPGFTNSNYMLGYWRSSHQREEGQWWSVNLQRTAHELDFHHCRKYNRALKTVELRLTILRMLTSPAVLSTSSTLSLLCQRPPLRLLLPQD
jgi:hypothetical protein